MSLMELFLSQGIIGVVLQLSSILLALIAILLGVAKSKTTGYACLAGAWIFGTAYTAFVARNMVVVASMDGVSAMQLFAVAVAAMSSFSKSVIVLSLIVVAVMAVSRFNRKHFLSEAFIITAHCLAFVTMQTYMNAIYLVFSK